MSSTNSESVAQLVLAPNSCQTCARRKVKCDKLINGCSSCRKSRLDCDYQKPPVRPRKRRLSDAVKKLARYEQVLLDHGLLPTAAESTSSVLPATAQDGQALLPSQQPHEHRHHWLNSMGTADKLVNDRGRTRYVDKNNIVWRNLEDDYLEDDETQHMTDDEREMQDTVNDRRNSVPDHLVDGRAADPLVETWMSPEHEQPLLNLHPTPRQAMRLWRSYLENVEPICKIVHVPTISIMLASHSEQPVMYSKTSECLAFAIYHFAVFSMTEEQCEATFGKTTSRTALIQKFHAATRQALTNAAYLKTTEVQVLQALVLLLLPCRYLFDPQVYWIWTGIAVRIGQRMGLHRDGDILGLPPFETEIRRRLFWQLVPLDGVAGTMAGAGVPPIQDTWDTKKPLNVNDDQLWPGMTEIPQEQNGATEMIYCLTRFCVGSAFVRINKAMHSTKDHRELEPLIKEAEVEVEDKYLRYCDFVNPLHVMTMCLARSAITAFRLRTRLLRVKADCATNAEKEEILRLSLRILDTDIAASANTSLRKFTWHMRRFFIWGSWDSLIFVLRSLRSGLLSSTDTEEAWTRVERIYDTHELFDTKQELHIAVRRLTMEAWSNNPPSSCQTGVTPAFIRTLQQPRKSKTQPRTQADVDEPSYTPLDPVSPPPVHQPDTALDDIPLDGDFQYEHDFTLDSIDWAFWDQLIQDYQAQDENFVHNSGAKQARFTVSQKFRVRVEVGTISPRTKVCYHFDVSKTAHGLFILLDQLAYPTDLAKAFMGHRPSMAGEGAMS
nr:transcription factor vrtr1 [Quercus suber]